MPVSRWALSLTTLVAVAACEPQGQDVSLPSGRQIRILGIGKMFLSEGPPGLMLKCQTSIPLDDLGALEAEADEIWKRFRLDVEKAQLTVGIVSANERAKGYIVTTNRTYTFVYTKSPLSGSWSKLSRSEPNK